jgi:hypothetical protein
MNNYMTTEGERLECISEGHLQFMRGYIRREEASANATLDRFLARKLKGEVRRSPAASKAV